MGEDMRHAALAFAVAQDAAGDARIYNKGDDAHARATSAEQRVDFEDFSEQTRPCAACFPGDHLNEGHAAFAVLERARGFMQETGQPFDVALAVTRAGNLFTTHTAVAAGFDRFAPALVEQFLSGFARRFATYKRPNLLLHDPERLLRLLTNSERPVQPIIAGKAHPADQAG